MAPDSTPADAAPEDFRLSPDDRLAVLESLLNQLEHYVFPQVAEQIRQDIQQRMAAGGYGEISGGQPLADILTLQLQSISQDPQLRLFLARSRCRS